MRINDDPRIPVPRCPLEDTRLIERVLSQPMAAAIVLRHALPPETIANLDWSSLVAWSAHELDPSREEDLGYDIMCAVRLRGAGSHSYVYVPIQHRSTVERMTALDLVHCACALWEAHTRATTSRPLPLVIPLVCYQGPLPWRAPRSVSELVDMPQALRATMTTIDLRYLVDDLEGSILDDPLASPGMLALVEATRMLLRWRHRADPITDDHVLRLATLLERVRATLGPERLVPPWAHVVHAHPPSTGLRQRLLDAACPELRASLESLAIDEDETTAA